MGGSFWNYVYIYMYLLILKEDFLFGGFRELCIYTYMYLSILKEAFIIWGVVFGDVFLFIPNLHNVLNKINIISGESLLFRINFIGISFVELKMVSFIESRRGISYYMKE